MQADDDAAGANANQDGIWGFEPGDRHWALLADVAASGRARGPLLVDARLATLAIEHGATLATTDRDFTRFHGLRDVDPLAP